MMFPTVKTGYTRGRRTRTWPVPVGMRRPAYL